MLDAKHPIPPVWLTQKDCDLAEFKAHVSQETRADTYPLAMEIVSNVPVYDGPAIAAHMPSDDAARPYMTEWYTAFLSGPGVIAVRGGYEDAALVDAVTEVLLEIIEQEKQAGAGAGDHFAAAGKNSRVWNAHEKLCMADPVLFARYNANPFVRRISESWLGPAYQITTQVNLVHPGGRAQTAHRDYHMGFQAAAALAAYPAHQHALSAGLTLQGAVAHSEMPLASGPTKLLPYSQSYLPGYLAVTRPDFRAFFEQNYVQLPLGKGDLVFFNPATFHAAGDNDTSDIMRFANLMQVGSAYGRSIEIVDRARISKALYPTLADLAKGGLTEYETDTVVAATAEGYPFPANLDIDSPLSGMAPPSQQDLMRQALAEGWEPARFAGEIDAQSGRKRSH